MLSLKKKFSFTFITILLINIVVSIIIFATISEQTSDGIVINIAGRQRMLSQKMSKESLLLAQSEDTTAVLLMETRNLFHNSLNALISGSEEMGIPPCENEAILTQLQYVDSLWQPFDTAVGLLFLSEGTDLQALQYINQNNVTLLQEMNKAVQMFETENKNKTSRLIKAQWGGMTLILIVIIIAWSIVISPLLKRLIQFSHSTQNTSESVSNSSEHISGASQHLASGTSEQAASLEEISASLQDISRIITGNADKASLSAQSVNSVSEMVEKNHDSMSDLLFAIEEIDQSSKQTAQIISEIENIAFQTNLLALNAAVEAARAGEAGKGFAVVADEVRSLSLRSTEAAHSTREIIEKVQSASQTGVDKTNDAKENSTVITEEMENVHTLVTEVQQASQHQANAINEISEGVSQLNQVTQTNAAVAEETSASSLELADQATTLNQIVHDLTVLIRGLKRLSN